MFLLNHKKHIIRKISQDEYQLLKQPLTPDTEVFHSQQKMLVNWREQQRWVQCDCLDKDLSAQEKPIMALRRMPSGLMIFSILPNSVPHHSHCHFYRMVRQKHYENGQKLRQAKKRTDFMFHRHAIEKVEDEDETEKPVSTSSNKPSVPGLQRFLYNLAHEAGTHTFAHHHKLEESAFLYRLKQAAKGFTINRLFRLSDYLYTHLNERSEAIYRLKVTAEQWVKSARPHCVFLLLIDEVIKEEHRTLLRRYRYDEEKKSWSSEDLILPKDCDLVMPGRQHGVKKNPALAAITYTDLSTNDVPFFGPAKAVVLPVVSKAHLMMVESNYERVVAKCLRRYQRFLARRAKVQYFVRVTKPLDDLRTPISDASCRPDFVLEYNNKKVILEVMGTHDEDYLERKERTVPLMEELAPVYEFDAYQADKDGELEQRAWLACQEALNVLFADDPLFDAQMWNEM
ncbi:hypothetical protein [Vibrio mediterranei]|uniref:hypothetical protein n=1 Tax=Vibrio mediterranei TaxID=689 RepID=UPI001EFD979D|nr:hypothetical protein [Vibrio mediterranei]MCG9657638.1 hypothetical protein [Vibrio mediterranei]